MEKECGIWINVLSHKLKKCMNANVQSLGLTGVQSRVMHYILVKYADGPVFQRDVENVFGFSRSTATGSPEAKRTPSRADSNSFSSTELSSS